MRHKKTKKTQESIYIFVLFDFVKNNNLTIFYFIFKWFKLWEKIKKQNKEIAILTIMTIINYSNWWSGILLYLNIVMFLSILTLLFDFACFIWLLLISFLNDDLVISCSSLSFNVFSLLFRKCHNIEYINGL